jgi:hypothetical protein
MRLGIMEAVSVAGKRRSRKGKCKMWKKLKGEIEASRVYSNPTYSEIEMDHLVGEERRSIVKRTGCTLLCIW